MLFRSRLIEVGPLSDGFKIPDATKIPADEVWLYGNVIKDYTFPYWPAVAALVAGLLMLLTAIYLSRSSRHVELPENLMLVLLLIFCVVTSGLSGIFIKPCISDPADNSKLFSMGDLQSMPAFSGHYTFLKSQPPYTYYEANYSGVPLSYLLEEKLSLLPETSNATVKARDGYKTTLSLSQINRIYPGNLKAIIAYAKEGQPLDEIGRAHV